MFCGPIVSAFNPKERRKRQSPDYYFRSYYSWRNPITHFWHRKRYNELIKILPLKKGDLILDAGCGSGVVLHLLEKKTSEIKTVGVDLNKENLKFASRICGAELYHGDIRSFRYDKPFDLIICSEVLEHLIDKNQGIRNLISNVRPGGYLLITMPSKSLISRAIEKVWANARRLIVRDTIFDDEDYHEPISFQNLSELLENNGMAIVERKRVFYLNYVLSRRML